MTSSRAPLLVLALVSALSLGARAYRLDAPCESPCRTVPEHVLMFDENTYVGAAEVIAGVHPQQGELWGGFYGRAPLGSDPNGEHPQGAKLVIAGAIDLFGNGPFAWRIGSLLFGTLAILGMYTLVRAAGGGPWLAVGAATLMAADNLMIVSGRVAMLDIYALAPMVWGVALYLRGRVGWAALVLAIADCMKEVSVYALLVLGLVEIFRLGLRARDRSLPATWRWRPALAQLAGVTVGSAALFLAGLWLMGLIAPPFSGDNAHAGIVALGTSLHGHLITGGPFDHLSYIINFAKSFAGSVTAGSAPWQWLLDLHPITYYRIQASQSVPPGGHPLGPVCSFVAMISPPILLLALPGLILCAVRLVRRRPASRSSAETGTAVLALAWFIGTWGPFALQYLLVGRVSYLYYMVIVMPGMYLAATYLASTLWRRQTRWARGLVGAWGVSVLAAAVLMFPFVAIL